MFVDMRIIWKAQLDLCKAIADDIIKYGASKEICKYADSYAIIESPYGTRGGWGEDNFIRINSGEAYCYVYLDKNNKPNGDISWNNNEMGINDIANKGYKSSVIALDMMTPIEARMNCAYMDFYGRHKNKEEKYVNSLAYIPYVQSQLFIA